jgi:hypothetical protein
MSMPSGYKSEFGYATVSSEEGCMGYREIAEVMTAEGDKMNHSTARNVFLRAMESIATSVCNKFDGDDSRKMSLDPRFQSCIQEIISDIYS